MFICQFCNYCTSAGIRARRIVVETQNFIFPERFRAQRPTKGKEKRKEKREKERRKGGKVERWNTDPGGTGQQIVREVLACSKCVETGRTQIEKVNCDGF